MSDYYDREGRPITIEGFTALLRSMGDEYRRIGSTKVPEADASVSTVWLGSNHAWGIDAKPLIFESMVFGGGLDQEQVRYSTEAEARAGHDALVQRVKDESAAFQELTCRTGVRHAAEVLSNVLKAHRADHDLSDYDEGALLSRLVKEAQQ